MSDSRWDYRPSWYVSWWVSYRASDGRRVVVQSIGAIMCPLLKVLSVASCAQSMMAGDATLCKGIGVWLVTAATVPCELSTRRGDHNDAKNLMYWSSSLVNASFDVH